jgi:hypothetical protein
MRAITYAVGIAIGVALVGCSVKQAPSPRARSETLQRASGPLDDTVTLQLGQRAFTRDRSLQLTYVRLVSESRCPANAICVWQGDAAVQLRTESLDDSLEATVHTALDPKVLEIGGNRISLLEVQPYPGTGDAKQPAYIVARVVREAR